MTTPRKILALQFDVEAEDGSMKLLIAWPDASGNGKLLVPAHPGKTLMDIKAGDVLIFNRKERFVVKRLKPYRTSEGKNDTEYAEIVSGAEWERAGDT